MALSELRLALEKWHTNSNTRVFHVSCLKSFYGNSTGFTPLPPFQQEDFKPTPQAVLDQRVHQSRTELLIHWEGLSPGHASWEDALALAEHHPSFMFDDYHDVDGGSDVRAQTQIHKRSSLVQANGFIKYTCMENSGSKQQIGQVRKG